MKVKILVAQGKVRQQRVELELPVIVGRSTDADLTINHPAVSRQHCELFEVDGRVRVRDLGSTNGTRVRGEKVAEAVLQPHDRFSIGPFTLVVDYREATDAASVPGEEGEAAVGAAKEAGRKPLPSEPSNWEESDDAGGLSWEEGPSAHESPPDRPADAAAAASPRAKPPAQASPAASVPPAKRPAKSAPPAAASASASGPDPELGIDLDELLEGLEGLDLNDFLRGIE